MQKSCFSYPVEFTEDAFGESAVLADTLRKVTGSDEPKVLIIADMNVVQRTEGLGSKIGRYVQEHKIRLAGSPVVIGGGEKIKADNLQSALKIVSEMLSAKIGRNDVVLAIGGGTILDVAGYAAAQVRGGVKLVRMPTTPAAMMDAAYAEYAAVDSATVKDALRVPSVPAAVVIDTSFAASVLDGVWRGGISEAPGVNRLAVIKGESGVVYECAELTPGTEVPFKEIGYDYTVSFDLEAAEEPLGTELFNSGNAVFYLSDPVSGKLGFSRDGYLYTFNFRPYPGEKVSLAVSGNMIVSAALFSLNVAVGEIFARVSDCNAVACGGSFDKIVALVGNTAADRKYLRLENVNNACNTACEIV